MSIKDLFNNPGTPKIQKSVTSDEMVATVESSDYVEAKRQQFDQFVPPIDFSNPSNFAKFGSAELYYEKAFERIHSYYPYDGTLAEKVEFENSSSYLDKYVFDNLYPRTNGYLTFTNQYIEVFGGPHTASAGMIGKTFDSTFDLSMKYDEEKKRTSAFEFRSEDGITIEFWLKTSNSTPYQTILHISGTSGDGDVEVKFESGNLQIIMNSGSTQISETFAEITDSEWNHYAVSVLSASSGIMTKGYKNGQLDRQSTTSQNIPSILPTTSGLNARIGKKYDNTRQLAASLDEFRFWKTARTPEQIFNYWFTPVGGGTNKHDANIALSCYLKFNEGITGNSALDSIVLDYSGRINNGTISNYAESMRNTGSAITEKLGEPEWQDPIIYSSHPDVVSRKAEYKTSGSLSDLENTSMLFRYFPGWMQEEDEQQGKQLKYLSQVLGSYFDTLWHQIGFVNKIHDSHYISGSDRALPFAKKLLYNRGFVMPDLFVDAKITENLLSKDDNEVYEKEINEVRNTIYHNIYSNLDTIYKSKGTEKAFRNFFRSIGIGDELVKLRMYADDSTFVLRNNYELKSFERKFLNFNYEGHFDATLYQTSSVNNSNIYIPGDTNYSGSFTAETEIILPKKPNAIQVGYLPFNNLTASVFGFHSGSEYQHPSPDYDLSVYVLKNNTDSELNPDDSHTVRFMVTGAFGELTSPEYSYQYENNKWNLAVKVRHENYPYANVTGNVADNYILEFYGVEADGYTKRNSFYLTSSISSTYFSSNKIFYAGAHRTNFTGSSVHNTDIKLGYLRYWHSFLSNDAIDQHAYDPETFGANEPFENDLVNTYPVEIPREKTLALHWAFGDLTGSNSSGELLVSDLSSGSLNSNYGPLSDTIQRYVQGKAEGFNASSQNALDKLYLQTARKRLPDDLMSSDLTIIKSDETEQFFVDDDVSDNFYAFEKSMWGTISDEMMSMFSTALDLNNLIGQPNQKYHHRYNMADFLRDRFFDDVENEPDIEKFTSFYKWIDDSISVAIQQLVPASARFSEKINNIIESHVLERNKYVHKVPLLAEFRSTEGSIKGISEMKYDWQFGHAPTLESDRNNEANHVLWQSERRGQEGLRETIRASKANNSIQSSGLTRREIDGTTFISDVYAVRKFARLHDFQMVSRETIHGGTNFGRKKNLQLFHESIAPAGRVGEITGVPQNIITVGVGSGQGIVQERPNNDLSPRKKKYQTEAKIGNKFGNEYGHDVHGDFVLPLNIMSGTVNSGFNKTIETRYKSGVYMTNLHYDVVGNYNETSIQGPFTEQHVGGLQYRHIDLNRGTDGEGNRPEGWGLSIAEHPVDPSADGALGFLGPDYEEPYPGTSPKAARYREEHAKRPVNVRNIKTTADSPKVGNYRNEIEIFQLDAATQRLWAREALENENIDVFPPDIANIFDTDSTTHYQTMVGTQGFASGNIFGGRSNLFIEGYVRDAVEGTQAVGSFVVTGATVLGTVASGSFELTGAPIPAVFASGSFETARVGGPATPAVGVFTVSGAYSPAIVPTTASFVVEDWTTAIDGAILQITQSNGSIFEFEVDKNDTLTDSGHIAVSSSTTSSFDFWDHLSSSLSSSFPDYDVSYVGQEIWRQQMLHVEASSSSLSAYRLYGLANNFQSSLPQQQRLHGVDSTSLSFWMYFDDFGKSSKSPFIKLMDSNLYDEKWVEAYVESGSLVINSRYHAGSPDEPFQDKWYLNNFTSSYSGSFVHCIIVHSGAHNDHDSVTLYVNANSASLSSSLGVDEDGSGSPVGSPIRGWDYVDTFIIGSNDSGDTIFPSGHDGNFLIGNIGVWLDYEISSSEASTIYNGGVIDSNPPSDVLMYYDFGEEYITLSDSKVQEVQDRTSFSGSPFDIYFSSDSRYVASTGSGDFLTPLSQSGEATFTLSASTPSADLNLTLNTAGPAGTFSSLTNATGGSTLSGSQDGDTLKISSSSGITTFTFVTGTAGPSEINVSGVTNQQMWDALSSSISSSLPDYIITTGSDNPRTFTLTSTGSGATELISFQETGSTVTIVSATNGTANFGLEEGDIVTIGTTNFKVTGSQIEAAPFSASFSVSGTFQTAGAFPSTATFTVSAWEDAVDGSILQITQSDGLTTVGLEISKSAGMTGPGNIPISGTSDTTFWNDLSSSLSSSLPNHVISYELGTETRGRGIRYLGKNDAVRGTSATDIVDITTSEDFTATFYLYFPEIDPSSPYMELFYILKDGTSSTRAIEVDISSNDLRVILRYDSYSNDYSYWTIEDFAEDYSGSMNQITIAHSGGVGGYAGDADRLTIYVNGVSASNVVHTPGSAERSSPHEDRSKFILSLDGKNEFIIDEVAYFTSSFDAAQARDLYNEGIVNRSLMETALIYYSFDDLTSIGSSAFTVFNESTDQAGRFQLEFSHDSGRVNDAEPTTGSATDGSLVPLASRTPANFSITCPLRSSDHNLEISSSGPAGSFSNITSSTGGLSASGSQFNDTITINDTTFTLVGTEVYATDIVCSGASLTDQQFWDNISSSLASNTDYIITTGSDNPRTFTLTSQTVGSQNTGSISETGTSFTIINTGTDGIDEEVIYDSGTNTYAIGLNSRTTQEFFNSLSSSIKTNTDFGTISINDLGTGFHRFDLTASVAGTGSNASISVTNIPTRNSFQNPSSAENGAEGQGLTDGSYIQFGGIAYTLVQTSQAESPTIKYIETTGTTEQIWAALQSKIEASSQYNVTTSSAGGIALFQLTSSITGSSQNSEMIEGGGSFQNLNHITGGTDEGGISDGDRIFIGNTPLSFNRTFVLTASSAPPTIPTHRHIDTTGRTSEQIWSDLKTAMETALTVYTVATSSFGDRALFEISSSNTGSEYNSTLEASVNARSFSSVNYIQGGTHYAGPVDAYYVLANTIPRTDLTGSERIINTRFSAPGGPEVQTISYLDAYSSTYSVHNCLPFRNMTVLGFGGGEEGTIRIDDHLGKRRGLKTLRSLHQGKFGVDSQYGSVTGSSYPSSGSFNKQHRNTQYKYYWNDEADITASLSSPALITSNAYDNMYVNSTLPSSEFQYSWINSAISSSNWRDEQHILGFAPKDGIISSSSGYVGAITFPSSSTIFSI